MTKKQITVTLTSEAIDYVKDLAKDQFENNASMAFGKIIAEHSQKINWKTRNDL